MRRTMSTKPSMRVSDERGHRINIVARASAMDGEGVTYEWCVIIIEWTQNSGGGLDIVHPCLRRTLASLNCSPCTCSASYSAASILVLSVNLWAKQ